MTGLSPNSNRLPRLILFGGVFFCIKIQPITLILKICLWSKQDPCCPRLRSRSVREIARRPGPEKDKFIFLAASS